MSDSARITLLEVQLEQLKESFHFHQRIMVGSLWQICKDIRSLKDDQQLLLQHLKEVSETVQESQYGLLKVEQVVN